MDFSAIFKKAFAQAWEHKLLWIFGLFASGMADFNYQSDPFGSEGDIGLESINLEMIMQNLIPFASGIIIFMLFIWALSLISMTAIIDASNRLTRGGVYSFRNSFSIGLDFFWRAIGISLVIMFSAIIGMVLIAIPAVLLSMISKFVGGLFFVMFVLVILPLIFFMIILQILSFRAMVIRDISIGDAIHEAYKLIMNNKQDCFVLILITFVFSLGVAIAVFIVSSLLIAIIFADPSSSWFATGLITFSISLFIGGLFGTTLQNAYTIFYLNFYEDVTSEPESIQPQTN